MPLDYSKWDHIQNSDDDDEPTPTSSARAAPVSPPQEVDLATRLNMGLSGGTGWAALSLKDCSSVTMLRDKLAAFTKMTMTEAAAEVDESMSEVLWELAKKLRVHASECDEALRADFAAWAKAMRKLAKCMTKLHVNLDLEDKRRSV